MGDDVLKALIAVRAAIGRSREIAQHQGIPDLFALRVYALAPDGLDAAGDVRRAQAQQAKRGQVERGEELLVKAQDFAVVVLPEEHQLFEDVLKKGAFKEIARALKRAEPAERDFRKRANALASAVDFPALHAFVKPGVLRANLRVGDDAQAVLLHRLLRKGAGEVRPVEKRFLVGFLRHAGAPREIDRREVALRVGSVIGQAFMQQGEQGALSAAGYTLDEEVEASRHVSLPISF